MRIAHGLGWRGLFATLISALVLIGFAPPAGSQAASDGPAIQLLLVIEGEAGTNYPFYRSTLFPPIRLDTTSGSSGPWPAVGSASRTVDCPEIDCDPPQVLQETVTIDGSLDPLTATLTATVMHIQEIHSDELRGASSVQLEGKSLIVTTGTLTVTWSDEERIFSGTMIGGRQLTFTIWDYDPGPGWTGRHPVTTETSGPAEWAITSPVLDLPLPAAAGLDTSPANSQPGVVVRVQNDSWFPYLATVVAFLVTLGVIGATGVFRGWWKGEKARPPRKDDMRWVKMELGLSPEPGHATSGSMTRVDTDGDGIGDTMEIVEHREGEPDRVRYEPIDDRPINPLTKAFAEWAVGDGDGPIRNESDAEREYRARVDKQHRIAPDDPDYVDLFSNDVDIDLLDPGTGVDD